MLTELISRATNTRVGLRVRVEMVDLDFPRSAKEMTDTLVRHALGCKHCLAVALFRQATLAEEGCDEYQEMLSTMTSVLRGRDSADQRQSEGIGGVLDIHCPEQHISVCSLIG